LACQPVPCRYPNIPLLRIRRIRVAARQAHPAEQQEQVAAAHRVCGRLSRRALWNERSNRREPTVEKRTRSGGTTARFAVIWHDGCWSTRRDRRVEPATAISTAKWAIQEPTPVLPDANSAVKLTLSVVRPRLSTKYRPPRASAVERRAILGAGRPTATSSRAQRRRNAGRKGDG